MLLVQLLMVVFITFFLLFVLYILNFFISVKKVELIKINTFERGFIRVGKIQNSFRIHFFIIILMFVIFDLEIVMFLGLLIRDLNSLIRFVMLMFFIFVGFYLE